MIIERYERPVDFTTSALSNPILQELDWILDDPELFALFCHDLKRHYKTTRAGRRPIPAEVTYRMIFLRRRKQWPYRQAEEEVHDSPGYRAWVRVYDHPVPDYSTLNDLERVIRPQTLHHMNDRVIQLAEEYHITQGYRLRVDSSVTETNVHHPTDSSLLVDGVRVLSRYLERTARYLPTRLRAQGVCTNHTRSARRRARHIAQLSRPPDKRVKHSRTTDSKKKPGNKRIVS
jgi:IS5 family transposase